MSLNLFPDFSIKRGDTLSPIQAALQDASGNPVALADTTVKFNMRDFNTGELVVSGNAVVVPPNTDGIVKYDWATPDTAEAGYFYAEWEVTFTLTSKKQTFPTVGYHLVAILHDLDSPTLSDLGFAAVRRLRSMVGEDTQDNYTDSMLDAMLVRNGDDLDLTAAEVWREKAASYAELVDVNNAGSSRKLSQLYDRAVAQAALHEDRGGFTQGRSARTRAIERA